MGMCCTNTENLLFHTSPGVFFCALTGQANTHSELLSVQKLCSGLRGEYHSGGSNIVE